MKHEVKWCCDTRHCHWKLRHSSQSVIVLLTKIIWHYVVCHSQTIKTNTFMNSSCPWFATMCTKTGTTGEVVSGSQPHPAVSFCAGALKRSGRQCWSSPKRLCRQACNETFKDNLPMMVMSHDILAMEKSSWMIFLWNMGKIKMQGISTVVEATVMEQKWPYCHVMPYPFASPLKLEHYFALGLIRLGQQWSPAALPADLAVVSVRAVDSGSSSCEIKFWLRFNFNASADIFLQFPCFGPGWLQSFPFCHGPTRGWTVIPVSTSDPLLSRALKSGMPSRLPTPTPVREQPWYRAKSSWRMERHERHMSPKR